MQVIASLNGNIAALSFGDITSSCTVNTTIVASLKAYRFGAIILITGSLKTNVNGTGQHLVTVPYNMGRAYGYIGAYGDTAVGEWAIGDGSKNVTVNISASSNNGAFCIVAYTND